jgi:hypothetical protein
MDGDRFSRPKRCDAWRSVSSPLHMRLVDQSGIVLGEPEALHRHVAVDDAAANVMLDHQRARPEQADAL